MLNPLSKTTPLISTYVMIKICESKNNAGFSMLLGHSTSTALIHSYTSCSILATLEIHTDSIFVMMRHV